MQELRYEGVRLFVGAATAQAVIAYRAALAERGMRATTHFPAVLDNGDRVEVLAVLSAETDLEACGDPAEAGDDRSAAADRLRAELASLEDSDAITRFLDDSDLGLV